MNEHPVIQLLNQHAEVLSGENIELFNRLLGLHSFHNSRRTNFDLSNRAFTHLGVLLKLGRKMRGDLEKCISLDKGFSQYTFRKDDPRVALAIKWFKETLKDREGSIWTHYSIPKPTKKRKRNVSNEEKKEGEIGLDNKHIRRKSQTQNQIHLQIKLIQKKKQSTKWVFNW